MQLEDTCQLLNGSREAVLQNPVNPTTRYFSVTQFRLVPGIQIHEMLPSIASPLIHPLATTAIH